MSAFDPRIMLKSTHTASFGDSLRRQMQRSCKMQGYRKAVPWSQLCCQPQEPQPEDSMRTTPLPVLIRTQLHHLEQEHRWSRSQRPGRGTQMQRSAWPPAVLCSCFQHVGGDGVIKMYGKCSHPKTPYSNRCMLIVPLRALPLASNTAPPPCHFPKWFRKSSLVSVSTRSDQKYREGCCRVASDRKTAPKNTTLGPHPPHSLGPELGDFRFFPKLKMIMKNQCFQ